jgi:hypothetical protein
VDTIKTIFIHCPKTGGCSVSAAIGGVHSREKNPNVKDGHRTAHFYRNMPDLSEHFVFSVARNPWDRLVSCWRYARERGGSKAYWLQSYENFTDFAKFTWEIDFEFGLGCEKSLPNDDRSARQPYLRNIVDCISTRGGLAVDYVCNLHTMGEDWKTVSQIIGIKRDLPWINVSSRGDHRSYYDDDTAEMVGKMYAKDISYFGFAFEDVKTSNFNRIQRPERFSGIKFNPRQQTPPS